MRTQTLIAALLFGLVCAPACAQSAPLSGIAHVAFRVSDLDKSRQWYERLGFQKAFEFKDESGNVTQAFIKINDRQFIELYPQTQNSPALGLTHVCYEAADIEAVRSAYIQRGLNPLEAKKARAGNLLFVLHDPDGQLVEYTQYLPGSLHSEDRGKHLGGHRISDHLLGATLQVKNVAAERAFYVEKLGFANSGLIAGRTTLRVGRDELKLEPASVNVIGEIVLQTQSAKRTAKTLRGLGLDPKMAGKTVQVRDPDGDIIVFATVHARSER